MKIKLKKIIFSFFYFHNYGVDDLRGVFTYKEYKRLIKDLIPYRYKIEKDFLIDYNVKPIPERFYKDLIKYGSNDFEITKEMFGLNW